ncbi:hypothetical protein SAMN05428970_1694 [Agromyces sp. CF514]|uniref:hypothetical protein n=1 Tax=Agromyces sp. CF514 TaxID=1881031 RepID=UPI0008DF8A33|nr:hypothetical protein [Agromyces sp. CF514]SFR74305.1 hypothetical protein SAMN05428970_1694 [Agromyces sp. CF514]
MLMDLVSIVGGVGFVAAMVVCSAAASRMFGFEQQAGLLDRRDPGRAEALRRADAMGSLAFAGYGADGISAVCTPSRRSGLDMARVRASDSDLRVEPPEEALPPMPATVLALADGTHLVPRVRPRHPQPEPLHPQPEPSREPQAAGAANSPGHHATASG